MMDKKIGLFIIGLWLALSYTCGAETNDNELIRIASCSDEYILKEGERLMNKGDMKAALLRFELLNARAQQNKRCMHRAFMTPDWFITPDARTQRQWNAT